MPAGAAWLGSSSAEEIGGPGRQQAGHEPAVCPGSTEGQHHLGLYDHGRAGRLKEMLGACEVIL